MMDEADLELFLLSLQHFNTTLTFFLDGILLLEGLEQEEENEGEDELIMAGFLQIVQSLFNVLLMALEIFGAEEQNHLRIQFADLLDQGAPNQPVDLWDIVGNKPQLLWWMIGLTAARFLQIVHRVQHDVRRPRNPNGNEKGEKHE